MSEENHDHCSFVSIHYIICECGETFPSEDALKAHLEKEHPHKRERKEYKCGICSNIYSTEAECIQHYEARHLSDGFNPDHCENEDSDEYADDKKLMLEVGDMEGELPPEEVALEEAIEAIEAIKQESLEEGEIPEEGASVVIENPKPIKKVRKTNRQLKNQRSIVCEVCGKYYASNAALRYHQRTHTGERPYQCSFCPKTFAMPLFLQIHVRTHTGEKPYQCPACPKAFSNKAALLRHDRVHSGEKPYKCPVCDKGFTQSNSMKLHVTTVHLKQPTPYKSKNRRLLAEERSQTSIKSLPNPRRKIASNINSVDVLKNGLEAYVLGPLKADLENLKADIDMLSRGELEEFTSNSIRTEKAYDMQDSIMFEVKDNVYEVIEEVLYEDVDGNCVVVSDH